jgi:hypothetical protein
MDQNNKSALKPPIMIVEEAAISILASYRGETGLIQRKLDVIQAGMQDWFLQSLCDQHFGSLEYLCIRYATSDGLSARGHV